MLLALWPAIIAHSQWISAGHAHETVTQRAIRAKEISRRKAAIQGTIAKRRLPEVEDGAEFVSSAGRSLDVGGISASDNIGGNATIRIPRYERRLDAGLPEALGASFAAGNAFSHELNAAMKAYAAKQAADEDDEMAMIIILAGM